MPTFSVTLTGPDPGDSIKTAAEQAGRKPKSTLIDLGGTVWGPWAVLRYAGNSKWLCRCGKCGAERTIQSNLLRTGHRAKCFKCEDPRRASLTHGGVGTRLYGVWESIKGRTACLRDSRYGGRGIKICEEWKASFAAFRDWALANGYAPGLSIDRIDNNGNYEPGNCRWATRSEQQRNRRNNVIVEFGGRRGLLADFIAERAINRKVVESRLRNGWSVHDALTKPVASRVRP